MTLVVVIKEGRISLKEIPAEREIAAPIEDVLKKKKSPTRSATNDIKGNCTFSSVRLSSACKRLGKRALRDRSTEDL